MYASNACMIISFTPQRNTKQNKQTRVQFVYCSSMTKLSYPVSYIPGPKHYGNTFAHNKIVPKLNHKCNLFPVLRYTHQNIKYFNNKYYKE